MSMIAFSYFKINKIGSIWTNHVIALNYSIHIFQLSKYLLHVLALREDVLLDNE